MTTRDITAPKINVLAALIALIVACLGGAALLTLTSRTAAPVTAPAEQIALITQRIPFEAQNALRGEASAFDALGRSMARLKTLTAGGALGEAQPKLDPMFGKFGAAVSTVVDARGAVEAIQAANKETRELAPKLLSELGDLASAVGVQKLDGMSRYLERFELTVQRIQQELSGLGSNVNDAAPAAQRLADSLEFLNQVMRGLSGEESGLALSRVTGAEAEQRLKALVQRNQQFASAVRKAIGAADPLSKAQAAARALPALASSWTPQSEPPSSGGWHSQGLDTRTALHRRDAVGRSRVAVLQVAQRAAQQRTAGARERAQSRGHHAPAR